MKTIALTAAALLVAAGSAFAANSRLDAGGAYSPPTSVDSTYTSSVSNGTHMTTNDLYTSEQATQDHRAKWGD